MRKSHKEELFKVAFRLFILKSFDGVSIPDIEKASGFTRGAIFYYADTKADLFRQVADYYVLDKQLISNKLIWAAEENHAIVEDLPLRKFIEQYILSVELIMRGFKETVGDDTPIEDLSKAYLKINVQIAEMLPDLHARQVKMLQREEEVWRGVIIRAAERGEIREPSDATVLARTFISIFYGRSFIDAFTTGLDTEELRDEMMAVYSLMCLSSQ